MINIVEIFRMKKEVVIISGILLLILTQSCVSIEAYQKIYLSDRDMALIDPRVKSFETDIQTYREGASGGNEGKTGGGCGCN